MSGTIDSKTVGSIQLGEKEIIENKVKDGHVDLGMMLTVSILLLFQKMVI